jgi:hypothetical protein
VDFEFFSLKTSSFDFALRQPFLIFARLSSHFSPPPSSHPAK